MKISREPKYRRPLNTDQLEVLELLYIFRFSSSDHIARYFGKNHRMFAFSRLKILEEQKYISKHYDASHRLAGKPAAYFLTPTGARMLQERTSSSQINLKMVYKSTNVSEEFIKHCFDIFDLFLSLRERYRGIKFFTKVQLKKEEYDYFPHPLPDAFVSLQDGNTTSRVFLDVFDKGAPSFAIKKRIKLYVDYWESGTWDDTGVDFPEIIFICQNPNQQERVQQLIEKSFDGEIAAKALNSSQLAEGLF